MNAILILFSAPSKIDSYFFLRLFVACLCLLLLFDVAISATCPAFSFLFPSSNHLFYSSTINVPDRLTTAMYAPRAGRVISIAPGYRGGRSHQSVLAFFSPAWEDRHPALFFLLALIPLLFAFCFFSVPMGDVKQDRTLLCDLPFRHGHLADTLVISDSPAVRFWRRTAQTRGVVTCQN